MTIEKRRDLVIKHLHIAKHLAKIWAAQQSPLISVDDLSGPANLGLVKAAKDFDKAKNDSFPAYARIRIIGEIKDFIREYDHLSRLDREILRQYQQLTGTFEERTEQMGLTDQQTAHLMTIPPEILSEPDDMPTSINMAVNRLNPVDENTGYDEFENVVDVCCKVLEPLQYFAPLTTECFRLHALNGLTYVEIGDQLGISRASVHTRIDSAYEFLIGNNSLAKKLGLEPGETTVSN